MENKSIESKGRHMQILFTVLLWGAVLGTGGVLIMGLVAFFRDKTKTGSRQNAWMRYRLYCQGVALLIFALLLVFGKGGGISHG